MDGDGWRTVPGRRGPSATDIGALDPDAPWFWGSLERYCAAGCCGFEAFDFSLRSVRHACGDDLTEADLAAFRAPGSSSWRDPTPGDPHALATRLRRAAVGTLVAQGVTEVHATRLNEVAAPATYADLFVDLAGKPEHPLPVDALPAG